MTAKLNKRLKTVSRESRMTLSSREEHDTSAAFTNFFLLLFLSRYQVVFLRGKLLIEVRC